LLFVVVLNLLTQHIYVAKARVSVCVGG